MKNKVFIQALNEIKPSREKKDKMLENILAKKRKNKIYENHVWKFGMVPLCFVCICLTMDGFYKEETGFQPASIEPRALMEEKKEICYQNVCYEEIKRVEDKAGVTYLETIYDNNEEIEIYQGEQKNTIIIKRENSYFLYQKIER